MFCKLKPNPESRTLKGPNTTVTSKLIKDATDDYQNKLTVKQKRIYM